MEKAAKIAPARYLALTVQHPEQQGVDCTAALKEARVDRASLCHTNAVLPSEQIILATRLLTEVSERNDLGLSAGALVGMGQLGDLGRAMLSCATLRDSLDCCARYFVLVSPSFSMQTRLVGSLYEIRWPR